MEAPPTLKTLPVELIAAIAEVAEGEALLSLRSTCREVCTATNDVFLNRYFKKRSHILTLHGLQSLVDITSNPHLARKIQHVQIIVVRLNFDYDPTLTADSETYERWIAERAQTYDNTVATDLLVQALGRLSYFGRALEITVSRSDVRDLGTVPHGVGYLLQSLGDKVRASHLLAGETSDCAEAVVSMLEAIETAECKVETLSLTYTDVERLLERMTPDSYLPCWASVKTLQLTLPTANTWREDVEWLEFDAFIAAMVNLESLDVSWQEIDLESERRRPILPRVGKAIDHCTLRSITFGYTHATLADYQQVLSTQSRSLRSLTLERTGLSDSECWSSMLSWLVQQSALSAVALHHLWRVGHRDWSWEEYVFGENRTETSLTLEGAEIVEKRLLEAALRPAYAPSQPDEEE